MTTVLTLVAILSLVLTLVAHGCVRVLLRRRFPEPGALPSVSVLKPVKGVDDGLYWNLASFAEQDYPGFQLLIGAEDPSDPALEVARQLQRAYPHVDIRIIAGALPLGRNPKVTNLATLCRDASHPVWLISDSNVRVSPSYLRETVAHLEQPGVGLVVNLFAGVGESSLGALLENLHLSTWVSSNMAGSQVVAKRACVVGKSMLFRRSLLRALGGWTAFADILAEDYVMGTRVERLGLRTVTAAHVVTTVNSDWTFPRFLNRHLRWAQIRRRVAPVLFLAEPLMYPIPWCVLLLLTGSYTLGGTGVLLKVASDALLARRLRGRPLPPEALLAIPPKDMLIAAIWVVGAFRRRVWWRGNWLRIGAGSRLLPSPLGGQVDSYAAYASERAKSA